MAEAKNGNSKYNSWDAWLQRIAWGASVVTSIVLTIFTGIQIRMNRQLKNEADLLRQPIFQVSLFADKSPGSDMCDYGYLTIFNKGEIVNSVDDIDITTFLEVTRFYKEGVPYADTLYVPIIYFFEGLRETKQLNDLIAYTKSLKGNYDDLTNLDKATLSTISTPISYSASIVHIIRIEYRDRLDKPHTALFFNDKQCQEEKAADIIKRSNTSFGYHAWQISDLSLDKLIEICNNKQ